MNDYEYDEELAGLIKPKKEDISTTILVEIVDKSIDEMTTELLNGIKRGLINSEIWAEMKDVVAEILKEYQVKANDYIYLFETMIIYFMRIKEEEDKLTGDNEKDQDVIDAINYLKYKVELSEVVIKNIINLNLAHIKNLSKLIKQEVHIDFGAVFTQYSDTDHFKTNPSIFERGAKDSHLFYTHLEGMGRLKDHTGLSFGKMPDSVYNMCSSPDNWLKPIFGQPHHIFFDILFECLAADINTRERLLECIAWKFRRPWIINLPSPVFCGVGGSGKSGAGKIFDTIHGRNEISWTAKVTEDSQKNNGFLLGKVYVNFDDLPIISKNSPEHDFIKQITHNKRFKCRDVYIKAFDADLTSWNWYNGNPNNDEKCPVPLEGDGAYGIDRRWMPSIVHKNLITVYGEHFPKLTMKEIESEIDYHFNNTCTNKVEVAKWLGNIIEKSGVDNKKDSEYPKTYHGHDYSVLTNQVSKQVQQIYSFVFEQEKPDFISVGDLYDTYRLHCLDNNIDKKFIKRKDQFITDIKKINNSFYEYKKWNRSRLSGSSQVTGWRKAGYTQRTVDYTMSDWLEDDALGNKKLKADYEILSYPCFEEIGFEKEILSEKMEKLKK